MESHIESTPLPEDILAALSGILNVGLCVCDTRGILVYVNQAYAATLGYEPEALTGRSMSTIMPTADAGTIGCTQEMQAEGGAMRRTMERQCLARDGRVIDLLVTEGEMTASDGRVYRILSVVDPDSGPTPRRELEAARARFESYFVHSTDNIFIVSISTDGSWVYEAHNPASERATGIANADLVGRRPEDIWPMDTADRINAQYRRVMETGEPFDTVEEMEFRGQRRSWHTVLMPVRGALGAITRIQGRSRDVTEELNARRKLKEAQDLLASIYDTADVGISVTDEAGRLVTVNRAYASFVSDEPDRLIGRKVADLIPIEAREDVLAGHDAVMRGDKVLDTTLNGLNRHGQPIVYRLSSNLLRDASGRKFSVSVLTDITRLKQLEQELIDREERLRHIADNMPALIGMADRDSRLLFVNRTFCDWFRKPRSRLVGMRLARLISGEAYARIADHVERARRGEEVTFNARKTFPDGMTRAIRISLIPRRAGRRVDGFYVFAFDVTAIAEAQEELVRSKERAEAASRAKSQFLANMSHELRTPLNAVIGFSDLMATEAFGPLGHENYREYATDILESGRHLLNLINGILDLSKIEAGRYELSEDDVDIPAVAMEALMLVRLRAQNAGVDIACSFDPQTPRLTADRRAIKQMLLNLLSNGVKFTPGGGRVTVATRLTAAGLAVDVSDTGIGIPPDKLPEITKPFVQVDNVLTRRYEGTGIGLYITKMLIELHGGRLAVDSIRGRGTTMSLVFPAGRLHRATTG